MIATDVAIAVANGTARRKDLVGGVQFSCEGKAENSTQREARSVGPPPARDNSIATLPSQDSVTLADFFQD